MFYVLKSGTTFLVAQMVKCLLTIQETWIQSLGREDLLEKEMATHSSILVWKIHGQRSLVGYSQSVRSQRVGHEWATSLSLKVWNTSSKVCPIIFYLTWNTTNMSLYISTVFFFFCCCCSLTLSMYLLFSFLPPSLSCSYQVPIILFLSPVPQPAQISLANL